MNSLGISFSGKHIRFVNINSTGEIIFMKEVEVDADLNANLSLYSRNTSAMSQITDIIKDSLESDITAEHINFSIDSANAFMTVIPVDMSENEANIHSRIMWDLSNYYPDNYKNFKINYYKLGNELYANGIYNILLIAIHSNLNLIFSKIFTEAGIRINIFDIDQLAVIKGIKPVINSSGKTMLVSCRRNRVDLSLSENDNLLYYNYFLYNDINFERVLRSELLELSYNEQFYEMNNIYIYGDEISEFMPAQLKEIFPDVKTSFIEVFSKAVDGVNTEYKKFSYRFAPAYGLALKGLGSV